MGTAIDLSSIATRLSLEDATFERQNVADLLHRPTLAFPGAQPVSFARHHLSALQTADYFMCEKTDGVRCLLFLTQYISDAGLPVESQFLIDRKNDYYHIPTDRLHIPRTVEDIASFHTGTLLDGELVLDRVQGGQPRLAYYIFDLLALDGEAVTHRPFEKRWGRVQQFLWEPYRHFAAKYASDAAAQPFALKVKRMEMPYGTLMMFKDVMPNLPHGNDGLIFTCVGTPYASGTDEHILKWKPPRENTVDFRLVMGDFPTLTDEEGEFEDFDAKPDFELHVNHGSEYRYFAVLSLTNAEWETLKGLGEQLDGRIVECFRDPVSGQWRPKVEHESGVPRFRDDKKDANHISVVQSVLGSIEDAVSEHDLVDAAGRIRAAWKERAAQAEARKKQEAEAGARRRKEAEIEGKRRAEAAAEAKKREAAAVVRAATPDDEKRPAREAKPVDLPPPEVDDGPTYDD